jgi:DNA-binding response OmpR family regulator
MKPRVLIVDDSATVRADLRGVLSAAGFSTLDVLLQDGDGVELLRQLRAEERTARIPVLVLSTEAAVQDRLRGLVGGANDYVGKPYDPAYVVKRAHELTQGRSAQPAADQWAASARRRRVLVVDDSPTFLHAVVEELRKDGHDLIAAASAEEALQLLKAQPVDCILMDLVLPGMDGIAAARLIRLDRAMATVPLLMFTARFESQKMAEALAAGVDAFCPKASDMALLRAQVRNLLRRRAAEAEAVKTPTSRPSRTGLGAVRLFDQVVARSGLSSVIAATTITRACRRANVEPEHLDVTSLVQCLPSIREALRVFLTEHETRRCMAEIEELTREKQPTVAAVGGH